MILDWMRQVTVDLCRYLPDFLYRKDSKNRSLLQVLANEHNTIRVDELNLIKQLYPDTATDEIEQFEDMLGMGVPDTDDVIVRQNRIVQRYQNKDMSTLSFMTDLVNRFGAAYIVEYNNLYIFNVYTTCRDSEKIRSMLKLLSIYKPAHIGIIVYIGFSWNGIINFNGSQTYGSDMTEWSDE